jgi:hypothetical protein
MGHYRDYLMFSTFAQEVRLLNEWLDAQGGLEPGEAAKQAPEALEFKDRITVGRRFLELVAIGGFILFGLGFWGVFFRLARWIGGL